MEWEEWAVAAPVLAANASVMHADTASRTGRESHATRRNAPSAEISWRGGELYGKNSMYRTMLKSKVHRATITGTHLDYEGSIGIDQEIMDASDIRPFEQVHVFNVNNGQRFITYAIAAPRHSGEITLNGAAARLGMCGDIVIVAAYGMLDDGTCMPGFMPKIVYVDSCNHLIAKKPGP
jgi:aspartate 1-decarboxylase